MLDENDFAEITRSPDTISEIFGVDDVESVLRDGIRLQCLLLQPEDRNAKQLIIRVEEICKKLIPEVLIELQNLNKMGGRGASEESDAEG